MRIRVRFSEECQASGDTRSHPAALTSVAVGTRITPRAPHRSVRAALPHTAPALSHDAKALARVRMKYPNEGNVARDDSPEPGPGHATMLTTPPQSMQPSPSDIPSECAQASVIARHGVVVEVALNHAAQPLADHRDRLVLSAVQRLSQLLEGGAHSLGNGQPLHGESTVRPLGRTDMCESQEVERLRPWQA